MSPIYPKLKEAGAVFEQVMGYERPTWFEPELAKGLFSIYYVIQGAPEKSDYCNSFDSVSFFLQLQ